MSLLERISNPLFRGHWGRVKKILQKKRLLFTTNHPQVVNSNRNPQVLGQDAQNVLVVEFTKLPFVVNVNYDFYIPVLRLLPTEWHNFMQEEWYPAHDKGEKIPMEKMVFLQKKYRKELFGEILGE